MENSIGINKPAKSGFQSSWYQILLPAVIGMIVISIMFVKEMNMSALRSISFNMSSFGFFLIACSLMLIRDVTMAKRFMHITHNQLSPGQALNIHLLSEFTSAVTPAAIGGSSLVVLFLKKEGLNSGKSTTIMFINLFLDELFFIIACPLVFLFLPLHLLFNSSSIIVASFAYVFSGLYVARLIWTAILYIGIFHKPQWIKGLFTVLFRIPFLSRFQQKANSLTSNLMEASQEFGKQGFLFWAKSMLLTCLSWTARFLVVNALFMIFQPKQIDHLVVFARQLVLWVYMVVSPTPGGSGLAEYSFKAYYSDIFNNPTQIIIITLLWRICSYYLYLLAGMFILPSWLKKSFTHR